MKAVRLHHKLVPRMVLRGSASGKSRYVFNINCPAFSDNAYAAAKAALSTQS